MNYYAIEVQGKVAVTASSPQDKLGAMQRIAGMLSPESIVKIVSKEEFDQLEAEDMDYE